MKTFTVTLPGGTKDAEYQAYVDLLKERGIDVTHLARIHEPGSDRRLLHVWDSRDEAQRFADELRKRTGNPHWVVGDADDGRSGPDLAPGPEPLTVLIEPATGGVQCRLDDADKARIRAKFPGVRVVDRVFISDENLRDMGGSVWEPWQQIAIVLTGLNEGQWTELGGIRVVDAKTRRVVWGEAVPREVSEQGDIIARLDQLVTAGSVGEVIAELTRLTYGDGDTGLHPHPPPNGYEANLWPWNRAGGKYLEMGKPLAAADVFAVCYLTLIGLQSRYHFRTHKGMPLCNIGVAMARAGEPMWARIAWGLGLVEDLLIDAPTALEKNNYRNLVKTGGREEGLRAFAQRVTSRFVDSGVLPTQPEQAWEVALHPGFGSFSPPLSVALSTTLRQLDDAYPASPDAEPMRRLRTLWATLAIPSEFAGEAGR